MRVLPMSGHIGAEIAGADLARPPADEEVALIRRALLRRKVVFFRGQRLDHAGQVAFARRFGEPVAPRAEAPAPRRRGPGEWGRPESVPPDPRSRQRSGTAGPTV